MLQAAVMEQIHSRADYTQWKVSYVLLLSVQGGEGGPCSQETPPPAPRGSQAAVVTIQGLLATMGDGPLGKFCGPNLLRSLLSSLKK